MSIYNSKTYINDLRYVINSTSIIKKLSNKTVMITGASGLICSGIVDLLLMSNSINNTNISIIIAVRNLEKAKIRFNSFQDKKVLKLLKFVFYNSNQKNKMNYKVDYIIHGASNAHPKAILEAPVETMISNFNSLYELLEYAKINKVKNTLFISSSEVYGLKEDGNPFSEDEYGFIDILNFRNSYSVGKRAGEALCVSFAKEYGIHTSIARPGHIYGPTALIEDSRVSSAFAFDAANGKDLILKSKGNQIRSYCYVLDCATAILTILLKGEIGNAYNISNPNSIITIKELAELYSKAGNTKIIFDLPTKLEMSSFNPMVNSSLNSTKLESLGWKGLFNVKQGVFHTIAVLKGE